MTDQLPTNETLSELFQYVIDLSHDMDAYHSQKLMEVAGVIGGVIASRAPRDQLPSKGTTKDLSNGYDEALQEIQRLREDLARAESAHAAVMAENAYYKQVAADRESALRNCLLLAMRHARRDSDWEHIIRFCREGGVEPSPLRTDCASCAGWRADQPPPVARTPDWCPTCMKSYAECRCNGD
jgi:hypothetical protein